MDISITIALAIYLLAGLTWAATIFWGYLRTAGPSIYPVQMVALFISMFLIITLWPIGIMAVAFTAVHKSELSIPNPFYARKDIFRSSVHAPADRGGEAEGEDEKETTEA